MQTPQPAASPLGLLLVVAILYLIFKSPKKLQTLLRMGVAVLVTVLIFLIPGALLRTGDPQAQGRLAGLIALLVAVNVGWWPLRSMNRIGTVASKHSSPKP